jgi:hypothetical protein
MALTYEWKVSGLRRKDQVNSEGATLSGAVVQTYWECIGTDENGNSASFHGATPFTATNVPAGSFVDFNDLTEETVLGWIQDIVNNDTPYKEHIDERILHQIEQDSGVIEDAGMPWAPEDVTPSTPDASLGAEGAEIADSGGNTDIIDTE